MRGYGQQVDTPVLGLRGQPTSVARYYRRLSLKLEGFVIMKMGFVSFLKLTFAVLAVCSFCAGQDKVLSSAPHNPAAAAPSKAAADPAADPAAGNPAPPDTPAGSMANPAPASKDLKDRNSHRYRIEPGDSFDVSFELSPEFNQTVSVQPDGYVTLRGVGDLKEPSRFHVLPRCAVTRNRICSPALTVISGTRWPAIL